jgi:hypothetical protein
MLNIRVLKRKGLEKEREDTKLCGSAQRPSYVYNENLLTATSFLMLDLLQ